MKRWILYTLIGLGALILIAAIVSWFIYPGWREDPAKFLATLVVATVGVVAIIGGVVRLLRNLKELCEIKESSPQTPSSLKVTHQEVTQSGGVGFGQENIVTVGRDVVGTQIHTGISPEQLSDVLAGLHPDQFFSSLHQLEPPPADFTGRTDELEELYNSIESDGVVIAGLYGMGGVGKTALALKLAEILSPNYPDAQIHLNLRGTDPKATLTSDDAMAYVIRSFHPEEKLPEGDQLKALYRSILYGKQVLLLMDNASDKEQAEDLIPPSGCVLLITSRQRFTLPGLKDVDLDKLPPTDAEDWMLKIAPRLGEDAGELSKICDYLPLALRVSASTLREHRDLSPADFIRQLRDLDKLLDLTGVEASLQLSYDLLPTDLQHKWCSLSVFPGSFNLGAAAAVWVLEPDLTRQSLSDLLNYSLLEFNPTTERYKMHDLARLLSAKLLEEPDRLAAEERHADYFIRVLSTAEVLYREGGEKTLAGLALFDLEWENIQAGQVWVADYAGHDETITRLFVDYPNVGPNILSLRLHSLDWIHWLESSLYVTREIGDRLGEGTCLSSLGIAYRYLGEVQRAIEYCQQALEISREVGDRGWEGVQLGNLGIAYRNLGEVQRSIEYYQQALEISREIGDRRGEGNHLGNLGIAYRNLGEVQRAIEYFHQSLEISREIGDWRGEGNHLGNLGNAFAVLGEVQRSIEYYQQALEISRKIGDRRGEGSQIGNLGIAYQNLGEVQRAIEYFQQSLEISREIGDRRNEGTLLGNLGIVYVDLGEMQPGIEYCQQALEISREIRDRGGEGNHLGNLGIAYRILGEVPRAIEYYQQALEICREIGDRHGEGTDLGNLGIAYANLGETQHAIEYLQQALEISREIGDRRGEGNHLGNLGTAYSNLGEMQQAIEYYQQALEISREIGDRGGESRHGWNLGLTFEKQGDLPAAIAAMQVCVDYELEIGHPDAEEDAALVAKLRVDIDR